MPKPPMNYYDITNDPMIDVMGSEGDFTRTWNIIKSKLIFPFVNLPLCTYQLSEKDQHGDVKLPKTLLPSDPSYAFKQTNMSMAVAAMNDEKEDTRAFAHFCFKLALEHQVNLNLCLKDHVLIKEDRACSMVFHEVYFMNYFPEFDQAKLSYRQWKRSEMLEHIRQHGTGNALWISKNASNKPLNSEPNLTNARRHIELLISTWSHALMEASLLNNNIELCEFADNLENVCQQACSDSQSNWPYNGQVKFNISDGHLVNKLITLMAEKLAKIYAGPSAYEVANALSYFPYSPWSGPTN